MIFVILKFLPVPKSIKTLLESYPGEFCYIRSAIQIKITPTREILTFFQQNIYVSDIFMICGRFKDCVDKDSENWETIWN